MRRFGLRDDQWERIRDLLAGREGSVGVTASDNRLFVEAVLDRYRTGMPWRDLPERLGEGTKVHLRFSRWAKSGVWERASTPPRTPTTNSDHRQHHCARPPARRWRPKKAGEDQGIGACAAD